MRAARLAVALLLCLPGCGGGSTEEGDAPLVEPESTLAWQQLDDAVRIWKLGAKAWQPPPPPAEPEEEDTEEETEEEVEEVEEEDHTPGWTQEVPFTRLDAATAHMIESPCLDSAVQFSCAITVWPSECRVTRALREGPPELRLLALTVLVRVKAPRTVDEQWKALQGLGDLRGHEDLAWLLDELHRAFSEENVRGLIERVPTEDRYKDDYPLEWGCRAAGVCRHRALLPRLVELSRSDHLDVSLAAQASLEDFPGHEGDDALASCLLGWQYDAYVRSAQALLERNPALLERTLLAACPPKDCVYWQGVYLGRLGNPAAVPLLCQELPRYQRIDREMFDLVERLARDEHVDCVDALSRRVRPEQLERARTVRRNVRARLGLESD